MRMKNPEEPALSGVSIEESSRNESKISGQETVRTLLHREAQWRSPCPVQTQPGSQAASGLIATDATINTSK